MEWIELSKTLAQLGLIPVLLIAIAVLWRKWWAMVDKLVTKYEAAIVKKDAVIAKQQATIDMLGEKRLEEYRSVITDYRDTLESTNARDAELSGAQKLTNGLLQQLLTRPGGSL